MKKTARGLLALAFGMIGATRAVAGIADSPLPVLAVGKPTLHLYSVPGVINDAGTNLGTFFLCTSTTTASQQVAVELFAANGAVFAPVNPLTVNSGETVIFATATPAGIAVDRNLAALSFPKGSARILSTSKALICSAFLGDLSATPTSMTYLTIVAKTKQKAAN